MSEKEILNYHLPTLGHIGSTLHAESAKIYRSLIESGECQRIQEIPLLGAVSEAWPGARHTRWDYMVLLIYLIRFCKERTKIRLNTAININDDFEVSSAQELLNCWAMLLQTGHLYWTFTSERVLLEQIYDNENYTKPLLNSISSPDARKWAEDVLQRSDYYKFHQVLAYYRLHQTVTEKETQNLAVNILNAYVISTQNDTLQKIKAYFQRLRRLAYLSLDSEYSPSVVSLRLDRILRDHDTFERMVKAKNSIEDELSVLEDYLVQYVYLGQKVLLEAARREEGIKKRIQKAFANQNLRYIVQELAKPTQTRSATRDEKLMDVVRFNVDARLVGLTSSDLLNSNLQKRRAYKWVKKQGTTFHLAFETDAQNKKVIFQAHAKKTHLISGTAAISYAIQFTNDLVQDTLESYPQDIRLFLQQYFLFGDIFESILLSTLNHAFQRAVQWEWGPTVGGFRVLWLSTATDSDAIEGLVQQAPISPSRSHEIRSTYSTVAGLRSGPILMAVANLVAFEDDGKTPLLEFDGVTITQDERRREVVLTIIEAKQQARGAPAACRKALSEKTQRLRCHPEVYVGKIRCKSKGRKTHAWRHLRLSYSNPKTPQKSD